MVEFNVKFEFKDLYFFIRDKLINKKVKEVQQVK